MLRCFFLRFPLDRMIEVRSSCRLSRGYIGIIALRSAHAGILWAGDPPSSIRVSPEISVLKRGGFPSAKSKNTATRPYRARRYKQNGKTPPFREPLYPHRFIYSTGSICQIRRAYSPMARSEEKYPAAHTLRHCLRANSSGLFRYSSCMPRRVLRHASKSASR